MNSFGTDPRHAYSNQPRHPRAGRDPSPGLSATATPEMDPGQRGDDGRRLAMIGERP